MISVLALLGLAVAVAGGWWVITEQMPSRAMGIVGAVVGMVVMVGGRHRRGG